MDASLLLAGERVRELYKFLEGHSYLLAESEMISNEELKIAYNSDEKSKNVNISLCNYNDVERFFITISIIRKPYLVVNDFISFDVFMDKNNIKHPKVLEGNQLNAKNIKAYLEDYAILFQSHGIELVLSNNQFPNYFPEWT